jgi:hypothetical protein
VDQIIRETDIDFAKWAVDAILHWKNKGLPGRIVHIHGTADKILPYRLVKPDYTIPGGTHVLAMNWHREISSLLRKLVLG